jgi:hypothetical protein
VSVSANVEEKKALPGFTRQRQMFKKLRREHNTEGYIAACLHASSTAAWSVSPAIRDNCTDMCPVIQIHAIFSVKMAVCTSDFRS